MTLNQMRQMKPMKHDELRQINRNHMADSVLQLFTKD